MAGILDGIRETILGVKSNSIDKTIDKSLENISMYSSNNDTNKYMDAFKDIIKSTNTGNKTADSVLGSLQRGVPQVQTYDQSGRISRYNEYESICNKIAYVQRALDVLVDHIISPDDVLKTSLQIVPLDRDSKDIKVNEAIDRIKRICKHFDMEDKIKPIIHDTLKFGDNFIEIVPIPKGKNALVVINEGVDPNAFYDRSLISKTKCVLENTTTEFDYKLQKNVEKVTKTPFTITLDESSFEDNKKVMILNEVYTTDMNLGGGMAGIGVNYMSPGSAAFSRGLSLPERDPLSKDSRKSDVGEDKFKCKYDDPDKTPLDKDKDGQNRVDIKDLSLVIHQPKFVIRLETQRFKICLGYLVFPKVDPTTMLSSGVQTNIDAICANFLRDIQKKLAGRNPILKNDDLNISDDIRKVLLAHLQKIDKNEDLKIRFVAPEFMCHFRINVSRYMPYGESLLDSSLFDCKLLMAQKTAATIKSINSCSDKRFVNVEIGLPRDAKNIVQKMEEVLTKKRVSMTSMGNIDSIPSQISTFENIFIPMKEGKKFVEIDHQQWGSSGTDDTDKLKTLRDGIVGNLGVPAPYLSIEDNASNRSVLTTESINFLRTVVSRQKDLSIPLRDFINKIYILIYGKQECDILSKIQITFNEPKALPNTTEAEYLEATTRVIDSLVNLGMSKDFAKRTYLPNIDWDKAEKSTVTDKLNAELNDLPMQSGDMMGGGMAGGMGGMGGGF